MNIQELTAVFANQKEEFFSDWKTFLTYKSISSDAQYNSDNHECATWLKEKIEKLGFKTEIIPTSGNPLVYGEYIHDISKPTLLFYGHYDVQPIDPIELWNSDPFKPELKGDRLYARGASDNKGQIAYFIAALGVVIKENKLAYNVKFLIEGEEESSSGGLFEKLPAIGDKLKSDIFLVCDNNSVSEDLGTIDMGLRGVIALTVKVFGAKSDLHSGSYGGAVLNPALEAAKLVTTLHDDNGKIAVSDYYDGVPELTDDLKKLVNSYDISDSLSVAGIALSGGEKGLTVNERTGIRPTIEINGIHSGYGGEGSKTVIPNEALIKITSRLVGKQDPVKCLESIKKHLKTNCPKDLRIEFSDEHATGGALTVDGNSAQVNKTKNILQEITGKDVVYAYAGGSIPILAEIMKYAGSEPILTGFALEEDSVHAPNESFSLKQFEKGFIFAGLFLSNV